MNLAQQPRMVGIWRNLTALLLVLGILGGGAEVEARKHRSRHRSHAAKTQRPPDAGLPNLSNLEPPPAGAPGGPDFPMLTRQLEAAYRAAPSPELLHQFGILAQLEGRYIEAQDLMRRYLADPLTPPGSPGRTEAEQLLSLPRALHGEVQVVADDEGLILVNGRLVGALPLALPLLLPVGKYTVALEMQDKTMKASVEVLDGRGAEMRFSRESGAVVVTQPPAVIVLDEYAGAGIPTEIARRVQESTSRAIQKAHLAIYGKEAALRREPRQAACLRTLACQAKLAARTDADYVLRLQIERTLPDLAQKRPDEVYAVTLQLIDAEVAEVAAESQVSCGRCSTDELLAKLGGSLLRVLTDGPGRARGTLLVRSSPSSAEILRGGNVLGQTPYERVVFAGTYDLILQKPGYRPEPLHIKVEEGKKARTELQLAQVEVEPEPAPLLRPRLGAPVGRPRWRLVTGGLAIGLGLALAGLGVSGVVIDGECVSPAELPVLNCRERFDTLTKGSVMIGVGAALSLTGTILIAVPPRASQPPLSSQFPASSTGTGITFSF